MCNIRVSADHSDSLIARQALSIVHFKTSSRALPCRTLDIIFHAIRAEKTAEQGFVFHPVTVVQPPAPPPEPGQPECLHVLAEYRG